jgi:hypothetical protein
MLNIDCELVFINELEDFKVSNFKVTMPFLSKRQMQIKEIERLILWTIIFNDLYDENANKEIEH